MTLEDIRKTVDDVLAAWDGARADKEGAHAMEDDAIEQIVRAIAKGAVVDPVAAAKELVRVYDTSRVRWYA